MIPSKPGKREKAEKYTQQQLIDLQSRLMLVAGRAVEGKAEVDRFVEVCYYFFNVYKIFPIWIDIYLSYLCGIISWRQTFSS